MIFSIGCLLLVHHTRKMKDPKNLAILSRNITGNGEAVTSALGQLIEINPILGIRYWHDLISNNISEIKNSFGNNGFKYKSIEYYIIYKFESELLYERYFAYAASAYAKDKYLLDIIYTKSPIAEDFRAAYPISYLIKNELMNESDNILGAIYKNKIFSNYAELWKNITEQFAMPAYRATYFGQSLKQPDNISNYCIEWIERINNEEERAAALTYAMRLF